MIDPYYKDTVILFFILALSALALVILTIIVFIKEYFLDKNKKSVRSKRDKNG